METDGTQKIRFDGKASAPNGDVFRFSVAGDFLEDDFARLDLEIFLHGDKVARQSMELGFLANPMNYRWLPAERESEGHVELLGLQGYSIRSTMDGPISAKPQFAALQRGIHPTKETGEKKLHTVIRLLPSGLIQDAMFRFNANGEIDATRFPAHTPILFTSKFGELRLQQSFGYRDFEEYGNKVIKRVAQMVLSGEMVVPQGSSLYDVNEGLKAEIEILCVTLSFCFRQRVQLAQIKYHDVQARAVDEAYYRRKFPENPVRIDIENFINSEQLGNGGLQRLVTALNRCARSADLVRAINFLSASYGSTLETGFFMAFSAMETVIDVALDSVGEGKLSDGQWDAIRRPVRRAIEVAAAAARVNSTDILAKLPELRRPAFKRQVERACAYFKVPTDDLWTDKGFLDGIGDAAALRNGLFHAAQYSDGASLYLSLVRVRALAERLIARLLEWPDSGLCVWRDQNLRLANSSGPSPSPAVRRDPSLP